MGISFSVVVITYKRREYLTRAVKSVLRQDYPMEDVQIVVVKAFIDHDIDRFLFEKNIETVFSDSEDYGKSLSDALLFCKGDVICLLDDDDLFAVNKLRILSERYSADPEIAASVNSYAVVDSTDGIAESYFGREERSRQISSGFRVWKYPDYELDTMILELNMLFNSSRISFKRELIADMIDLSKDISYMVDILPVTLAITHKKAVASIPEQLTMYRIHSDNISISTDLKNRESKLLLSHKRIRNDCSALENYFCGKIIGLSYFFRLWKLMESLKIAMLEGSRKDIIHSLRNFVIAMLKHHSSLDAYRSRLFTIKTISINIVFSPLFLTSRRIALILRFVFPF